MYLLLECCCCFVLAAVDPPTGVVIDHSPASSRQYIGSPSIAVLPDGTYVASHDLFGPGSTRDRTKVFASSDRGATWTPRAEIVGQWWSTLFTHRGALYLMGTSREEGHCVIRRSDDGGRTWTDPTDAETGLLHGDGTYHCAPVPVVEHRGRLWRAMEDTMGPGRWGSHFRSFMMSAPVDADLLRADSWTSSNRLPRDPSLLEGRFGGWLEGNAVVTPEGRIVNILRADSPDAQERAAVIQISDDGRMATFDPATGFVPFPGGAKKFTIRFDPQSRLYWTLANYVPESRRGPKPSMIRNTLALVSSPDLRQWDVRNVLVEHPDPLKHGVQYVDWQFDGDDLIAVVRTAFDDDQGGAHNQHDANFMTFLRVEEFRDQGAIAPPAEADPMAAFRDGAKHYRDGSGSDDYERHDATDAIAENLLIYQRDNGGWPSNFDPQRVLEVEEAAQIRADSGKFDSTLDNRASYPCVTYLASAHGRTTDPRYREACLRGIEYLLAAQHASGGWPHTHPGGRRSYDRQVTIVDDVTVGTLDTVNEIASGREPFTWVAPDVRKRCREAAQRGLAALLRLQVRTAGEPTVWAGQYDAETLEPCAARSFEPPALISAESVGVVEYLLRQEPATPEVRAAIEGAARWFEARAIQGLRIDRVKAEPVRFVAHTSAFDLVEVRDSQAPRLWARYYDLDRNQPLMTNRDGRRAANLAELERERRTGYSWYGPYATRLLEVELPAWRERQALMNGVGR